MSKEDILLEGLRRILTEATIELVGLREDVDKVLTERKILNRKLEIAMFALHEICEQDWLVKKDASPVQIANRALELIDGIKG